MLRRRSLHGFVLGLALGAPALAQDPVERSGSRGDPRPSPSEVDPVAMWRDSGRLGEREHDQSCWPEVELDADLAAAETWVEVEAPARFAIESRRVGGWRIEVVVDREAGTASARAVRPDGRLAWSFPGAGDACERIDVVHVGTAGGWLPAEAGPDASVVLRADRGGHAGGTAIVLRASAGGLAEVARVDVGSGGLEVLARAGDAAPPDLRARDEALACWTTSSADAPRPLLRWRWDGEAYGATVEVEPTTVAASSPAREQLPEDGAARAVRLGRIVSSIYRGELATAAAIAREADPRGLAADGFASPAAFWAAIVARVRAGAAWPALVRATPGLAALR